MGVNSMESSAVYMTLEEVMALFGYTSKRNARICIRDGSFPVPMEKQRGRWVVDAQVVRHYFDFKRKFAMEEVERRIKEEHRKLSESMIPPAPGTQ